MFSKNLFASVILAGTIAITGTTVAFAVKDGNNTQNTPNTSMPAQFNPEQMHSRIKSALDGLVKAGTITQAQEDAVVKAMADKKGKFKPKGKGDAVIKAIPCKDGKCKPHGRKHGVLKDLAKKGTITQDQADAIKKAIKSARESVEKSE